MNTRISRVSTYLAILFFAVSPVVSFAQTGGTPGNIIPDCNQTINATTGQFDNPCDFQDLLQLLRNIIRFVVFYLTLPALTIGIGYAGFLLLTSMGDSGKRNNAKDILVSIAIGLFWMFTAWFVVEAIYSGLGYGGFLDFG
jgi:hypothetical protein